MQLNFKVASACQTVCRKVLTPKEKKHFIKAIDQEYRVHWCVFCAPLPLPSHPAPYRSRTGYMIALHTHNSILRQPMLRTRLPCITYHPRVMLKSPSITTCPLPPPSPLAMSFLPLFQDRGQPAGGD